MATPSEGNPSGNSDGSEDRSRQIEKTHRQPHSIPSVIEAGAAILLVLITGTYTYYAAGQVGAIQESNRISRDALVSVQRAFVTFAGQGAYTKIPPGKKTTALRLTLPWYNSGSTPTRRGYSQVNWRGFPQGLPQDFGFRDEGPVEHAQFVIAPKSNGNATLTIPIGWMDEARKGHIHLVVWGWITYRDIFDGTPVRLSEFCDEITDITSSTDDITDPSSTISSQVALCPEHNCSDEECRDYEEKTKGK